jgi:hypothetical protein
MTPTQADATSGSPKAEGKDRLTALPTELLVDIVKRLPVQEICRLRSLSRHLRAFVDTNQGQLTRDLINYHRTRINREYTNLTDLSDCDIIDALRRYDSHYGLARQGRIDNSSHSKLEALCQTLYFNWANSHRLPVVDWYRGAAMWISYYTAMGHACSSSVHIERLSNKAVTLCQDQRWSHGITDLEAFGAKFAQVRFVSLDAAYAAVPSRFITRRKIAAGVTGPLETRPGFVNRSQISKLERLLDLPDLQSKEDSLAYCSSSVVDTALLIRKVDQGPSTGLKQAAIIEQIFIY